MCVNVFKYFDVFSVICFLLKIPNEVMLKETSCVTLQVHLDFLMPKALDGFLTKLTDVSTTNHTFSDVLYYTRMYCVCRSINVSDQQSLFLSLPLWIFAVNWKICFVHTYLHTYTYIWLNNMCRCVLYMKECVYKSLDRLFSSLLFLRSSYIRAIGRMVLCR